MAKQKVSRQIVEKRIEESVRTMKTFHGIVSGLALTAGILAVMNPVATSNAPTPAVNPAFWLAALIVTIIPFHHGALRHMDDSYVFPNPACPPPKELALLIDFLILLFEAIILVYLSQRLFRPELFVPVYFGLLVVDVLWAVSVHFLTSNFANVRGWLFVNIGALALGPTFWWSSLFALEREKQIAVLIVMAGRSIVDYIVNWGYYFPSVADAGETNECK